MGGQMMWWPMRFYRQPWIQIWTFQFGIILGLKALFGFLNRNMRFRLVKKIMKSMSLLDRCTDNAVWWELISLGKWCSESENFCSTILHDSKYTLLHHEYNKQLLKPVWFTATELTLLWACLFAGSLHQAASR